MGGGVLIIPGGMWRLSPGGQGSVVRVGVVGVGERGTVSSKSTGIGGGGGSSGGGGFRRLVSVREGGRETVFN